MSKATTITIDEQTRKGVESVLASLGYTPQEAIHRFYFYLLVKRRMPSELESIAPPDTPVSAARLRKIAAEERKIGGKSMTLPQFRRFLYSHLKK
jgi:antitoxin component of RelBE/YafQ-DinJ toxin-antitoxin module